MERSFSDLFYILLFAGKQIQYYFFMFLNYLFFLNKKNRFLFFSIVIFITVQCLWGMYQLITNNFVGYYALGALFYSDSPSLSGQIYLSSILFLSLALFFNLVANFKWFLKLLIFFSFICCLATLSRTSIIGMFVFGFCLILSNFLLNIKANNIFRILKILVIILFLFKVFGYSSSFQHRLLKRFSFTIEALSARKEENWSKRFYFIDTYFDYLFGLGFAESHRNPYTNKIDFTMAFDSQYVFQLLTSGILGTIIWLFMLTYFLWCFKDNVRIASFYFSLLVSYLVMGIGYESFELSKSGFMFWSIVGILFALRERNRFYLSFMRYKDVC